MDSKPDHDKSVTLPEQSAETPSTAVKSEEAGALPVQSDAVDSTSVKAQATTVKSDAGDGAASPADALSAAHHTPKILAEVLDEPVPKVGSKDNYRHPFYMDALIAIGLLVAMAGFTVGVIKIYITHTAKTYITARHYKEAIVLLAGAPLPGWFAVEGESPEELLNQALYLDGMEKLDLDDSDQAAIKELEKIKPGSRFFELANQVLTEHAPQSSLTLQGAAEHEATPAEVRSEENKPIMPETNDTK